MRRLGVLAVLVLFATAAANAGAATRIGSAEYIAGGIDFAGSAVIFDEIDFDAPVEDQHRVWLARPGDAPRHIANEAPKSALRYTWPYLSLSIASSGANIAIARDEGGEEYTSPGLVEDVVYTRRQLRGLRTGSRPGWRLPACSTPGWADASNILEADGDALVAPVSACRNEGIAVRLFSQGGATARTFPDANATAGFDVAGPYVAYLDRDEQLVVADWRTGVRVLSAPAPRDRKNLTWHNGPALQPDGTVVLVSGPAYGCVRKLFVLSPRSPAPRELPVTACGHVSVAGGRIALVRKLGRGTELVTVDLAGADLRPVARFGEGAAQGVDFDGRRIAWSTSRCADSVVSIDDWDPERVTPAPPVDCPAYVKGRSFRVDAKGTVRIPFRCPQGCNVAFAWLTTDIGEAQSGGPGRTPRAGRLTFRLDDPTRRRLRRRGSLKAEVELLYLRPGVLEKRRRVVVTLRP